jgi:predicted RNA polymerase sigma factor
MELLTPDPPPDTIVRDDQLRLIFTCCHPALSLDAQVALALRTLCQLSVEQVAAVLLTTPPAMAKRLTRTRQKIATAHIPYRIPAAAELPARVAGVCGVVHALYTVGHAPISGSAVLDVDVCTEAIRVARLVHELMPDEAAPTSVLALFLLTEARRPARTDPAGEIVILPEQDRSRWDRTAITEGLDLLNFSLRRTSGLADPYQLQAAIAAEHARADNYDATDWSEVVRLYDLLLSVAPSPAAALARSVAVGERDGPARGLAELEQIAVTPRWHAVRAELLARDGNLAEAIDAGELALAQEATEPERRHREQRLRQWRQTLRGGPGTG